MDQPSRAFPGVKKLRKDLLSWYRQNARHLPWRESDNAYHIWLSEIMLQQTRVDQARPYFERFLDAFPTVSDLAKASLDEVLVKWEGLGYYSRARNLHRAARQIIDLHGGRIPDNYDAIRSLPGIGHYTAAAVLSIAYGRSFGVLDGNVIRVLTRLTCNPEDASKGATRRTLQTLSDTLVAPEHPGDFNQAMMELGAMICTPKSPLCGTCPLQHQCCAFAKGAMESFPFVKKKAPLPHYDIAVGIIHNEKNQLLIQRRPEDGLLGGLWEFPGGKKETDETIEQACIRELEDALRISILIERPFHSLSHAYTHFKITLHAFLCRIESGKLLPKNGQPTAWVHYDQLDDYAFARSNRRLIELLLRLKNTPTLFD